ncbi:gliding motility lipoprotein GldH [Mucilaginibacter sp. PPCGB 2223]|uniref:gliding motility lipoprotein GldH n=1 Tax=Mucilaginibacter sp. PPCGB 2223 TaxID=1886027 RepID=UPI000826EA7C|nr:gliding motility lipoprotein GldH [Mucilaginibacter sp. PPCGB 2223]OCX50547.1 gliding motility lipoprotein GldH [Mucilaginibacter sp. PPCGB 2223]
MKTALKSFILLWATVASVLFNGCVQPDKNTVIDGNVSVYDLNWSYVNKVKFDVKIDDASARYNLLLNLRVTPNYRYSNIFILIHQTGPDKKTKTARYEFKLANPDGEWLGQGTGNLYSYQIPFEAGYKFPAAGTYRIELEQNMRDNPLHEVSDVGLRVEKAQ